MIYIVLNLIPISAATFAALIIGLAYRKASTPKRGSRKPSFWFGLVATAALFWLASILAGALILAPPKADPWIMATGSAIIIWVGFVMPVIVVTQAYRGATLRAIVGDCSFWLVAMVVQAVVMKAIGLIAPPV